MLTDYFFPHLLGGTEKTIYEISRRLVKRGYQVTVITLDVYGYEKRSLIEGINVYRLPAISLTRFVGAQLTISPISLAEASKIIRSTHPDVIHAHNLYFNLTAVAPILKRLGHLPLITTLHLPKMQYGQEPLDTAVQVYLKTVGQFIVQSSDKIIVVSRSVLKHAIEDLGANSSKIIYIPNGVDSNALFPSKRPPKNVTITYVGRLIQNKGPQYLVQAGPEILKAYPKAQINIVGEGPLKDKLMMQVASQKLEDRIRFLGNVSNIFPVLQATTVFVRPSLTEGMSLAILEAMACGLPVVASNVDGNSEIIENGKTGLLVPPGDWKALAEAIILLLKNHSFAMDTGRNARSQIEEFYSWEQITEQTEETYSSLARADRRV